MTHQSQHVVTMEVCMRTGENDHKGYCRVLRFSRRPVVAISIALFAIVWSQQAAGAPCNHCLSGDMETPIPPARFGYFGSSITPFIKQATLNWCGVVGAPSVGNPSLVCAPDLKSMLLKRNSRAT